MVTDFCRLSEVVYKPSRPIMGEEIQDIIADTNYIYNEHPLAIHSNISNST